MQVAYRGGYSFGGGPGFQHEHGPRERVWRHRRHGVEGGHDGAEVCGVARARPVHRPGRGQQGVGGPLQRAYRRGVTGGGLVRRFRERGAGGRVLVRGGQG